MIHRYFPRPSRALRRVLRRIARSVGPHTQLRVLVNQSRDGAGLMYRIKVRAWPGVPNGRVLFSHPSLAGTLHTARANARHVAKAYPVSGLL